MAKGHSGHGINFVDGTWIDGGSPVLSPQDHAVWLSSIVFDGARSMQGKAPDLDRHCARAVNSAKVLGLDPGLSGPEIEELAWEGIRRFDKKADLYICPMFYAKTGFIVPDPESTKFILSISESPMPEPDGFSACLSSFRRPAKDMAPTEAKASCLYPNVARCVREATDKGFDTAVVLDPDGNVAEFAYANLFFVKHGAVHTPAANGTFLNGITRQRVIELLKEDGATVDERTVTFAEVEDADEVFCTSNYFKVAPCTRIEDRHLQAGPVFRKARELYLAYAGSSGGA